VYALALPTFADEGADLLTLPPEDLTARVLSEFNAICGPSGPPGGGDSTSMPFAFYGHSMGGYVALNLVRAMVARRDPLPALVAIGAMPIPDDTSALRAAVRTPEDVTQEMAEALIRDLDGGSSLASAERGDFVELARRDLWLSSRGASPEPRAARGVPALLLAGEGDPLRTIDKLAPDARVAMGYEDVATVPGGHLFLMDRAGVKAAAAILVERMAPSLGSGPAA
jgi:surfactin synthase thioesterase subunit